MEKKAFKPVRNTQRVEHKKVLEKNKNLSNASKTQPLVSVVISCYNSEKYLPDALISVVEQTYDNLEVIIINNGSSGDTEKIYTEFSTQYQNIIWKYFELEQNIGLLRAYYIGFSNACGDFICTVDCDDAFSIDFVYQMVVKATAEQADVVSAICVDNYVDLQQYIHHPMDVMETRSFCWEGDEILAKYLNAHGGSMQWCTVWSKMYTRELFLRAKPFLEKMEYNIACCADVLLSTVLLSQAHRWVNTHYAFYYYARHNDGDSQNIAGNIPRMNYILESTVRAFDYVQNFLVSIGKFDELSDSFVHFKEVYSSVTFQTGKDSHLSKAERKKYLDYACRLWKVSRPTYSNDKDWFFTCRASPFSNSLEKVLHIIRSDEYPIISFDVFDSLIERPFLRPWDTFEFLSSIYNKRKKTNKYINFAHYRVSAEINALKRKKAKYPSYSAVNLEEIYAELVALGLLAPEDAIEFLNLEIKLEKRFCTARHIGKYLFDFARRCGKRIVCISDMYLSSEVIRGILEENGFLGIDSVFVSADERVCKSDGRLFKRAYLKLGVAPNQICHIGDNYKTDILMAQSLGMKAIHITSASDIFMGKNSTFYSGQSFGAIFGDEFDAFGPMDYLGTRCLMGVAAKKVFNNPFEIFNCESDFDSNPSILGYYVLGTYVFSIANWLLIEARKQGYETIHFLARDGLVIKQAYDILAKNSKQPAPKSNYLHVSRKAMMPFMVNEPQDVFYLIRSMDILSYTPLKFLEQIRPIIPKIKYDNRRAILDDNGVLADTTFQSEDEWNQFLHVLINHFYDRDSINTFRSHMKPFFCNLIGAHDCTFDVGHSVRTETLLSELIENPVSVFYLHYNDEHALKQAHQIGANLTAFHTNSARPWEWVVLEKLICDTKGSCSGYRIENGKLEYEFGKPDCDEDTASMINFIHEKAIEFISDFVKTFPEWESFEFRFTEKPFLYYFYHAKPFDKGILQNCTVSDSNSSFSNNWRVVDHWNSTPAGNPNYQIDNRTSARKIADLILPKGTRRREFLKKILPKGSLRWKFCKQVYFVFAPQYRPSKR